MEEDTSRSDARSDRWLLLIHQLPAKPAYLRVKIWRRLQGVGAVAVKNTVYALPAGDQTREDFHWILAEIAEGGGEAMVCEARLIDGLTDRQVRALFDAARDVDYETLAREARDLAAGLPDREAESPETRREARLQVRRLRRQFDQIVAIDFFGAHGREPAEALLSALEARVRDPDPPAGMPAPAGPAVLADLMGRTWVTRQGVHVDRIASAWLVRRFIDPDARFGFVADKDYRPQPGELRFDMFEAEFTHEGDRCTFEVLLDRIGRDDPALRTIAEIVHDIDLKDGKFAREEVAGIAHLIAGIALGNRDDRDRIARGGAVFDDLYQYFRRRRGGGSG